MIAIKKGTPVLVRGGHLKRAAEDVDGPLRAGYRFEDVRGGCAAWFALSEIIRPLTVADAEALRERARQARARGLLSEAADCDALLAELEVA